MHDLMSALRKETAEEQLLRLIEGAKGPKPQVSGAGPMNVSPMKNPLRGRLAQAGQQWMAAARFRLSAIFGARQRAGDSVLQQLQLASSLLWVVLLALGIYLGFQVVQDRALRKAPLIVSAGASQAPTNTATPPPSPDTLMKPMAEYLSAILQRNPFTGASGTTSAAPIQRARERLKELTSSLAVVGIDRGATPEALIEDKSRGKTYFVKVGDVVNGAFVKEISARGVIVEYEGEEELLQ